MSVAQFNRPGASDAFLTVAGCSHVGENDCLKNFGFRAEGIAIPFRHINGSPLMDGERAFARVRLYDASESQKYHQRPGSGIHVYVPPTFAQSPKGSRLTIVEGEFKSLALAEAGYAALGLCGFTGAARTLTGADGDRSHALNEELFDLLKMHQPAQVVFLGDSDVVLNAQFAIEAAKLRRLLFASKQFQFVKRFTVAKLPQNGAKGIDDLRAEKGDAFTDCFEAILSNGYDVPAKATNTEVLVVMIRRENEAVKRLVSGQGHEGSRARTRLLQSAAQLWNELGAILELKPLLAEVLGVPKKEVAGLIKDAATERKERARASKSNRSLAGQNGKSSLTPPLRVDSQNPENFANVTAWIRGKILESICDKETPATVKYSAVAANVVTALAQIGRFYFHADLRDFDSSMFFDANRKRLERIRSDSFAAWLAGWIIVNRVSGLFKFTLSAVETAALSGAHTTGILPESYWAARAGALYLSNGDGGLVKITGGGVQPADNGTDGVLFSVGRTLSGWKLTSPQDPFDTCAIFRNVHCGASHGKDLLRLWSYSFATMPRSKPPLGAIGEIGSGKTRTLKGIAELYGIPFRAAKVEEQLEPNFWPNVNEGGLFILDNADTRCRWLADAVAAAATDGCSQRRKLYTNSETVTLRANAWLAITSANPTFGNDAGLADRLLPFRMERGGEDTSDAALTAEILSNRDAGLSHVATTLQKALVDNGPTPMGLNARHPDFAAFAVKIGRALGRELETITALQTAESDKSSFCLENDSIGAALFAFLSDARTFTGTAAELAPKLCEVDAELKDKLSAKRLGKRLSALWPHLQKALGVAKKETDRKNFTVFNFKAAEFAEFKTAIPPNPLCGGKHIGFKENTETNSANSANPEKSKELTDAALVL
jgi:hypothetical protein